MRVFWHGQSEFKEKLLPSAFLVKSDELPEKLTYSLGDVIVIDAEWENDGNLFQGIEELKNLRLKEEFAKIPVVIYSFEHRKTLIEKFKFSILETPGITFLQLPFSHDELQVGIKNLRPLTDEQLANVRRWHCGLQEKWSVISHKLGGLLAVYPARLTETKQLAQEWSHSIELYASEHTDLIERLQQLLDVAPHSELEKEILSVLQRLQVEIKYQTDFIPSRLNSALPKTPSKAPFDLPPEGFSKILIADDTAPSPLAAALRDRFQYEVLKQATNLSDAKKMLLSERPHVVLADYYFPSEKNGLEFMNAALNQPRSSGLKSVLVVSKNSWFDGELPDGVVNCSGINNAVDEDFFHRKIWEEAKKAGVTSPANTQVENLSKTSKLQPNYRKSVNAFAERLMMYVARWRKFGGALRNALKTTRELSIIVSSADEHSLVETAIKIFESQQVNQDLPLPVIIDLVEAMQPLQNAARRLPKSETNAVLRSLLHTIQNYSLLARIKPTLNELEAAAQEWQTVDLLQPSAEKIQSLLQQCQENAPSLNLLSQLKKELFDLLQILPPSINQNAGKGKHRKFRIVIVEDDEDWRDFMASVVNEVADELSAGGYEIRYENYSNAEDARRALPEREKFNRIVKIEENNEPQTIAVVDLYLPKDSENSAQIIAESNGIELSAPLLQHGLDLISDLRAYKRLYPTIVWSNSRTEEDSRAIRQRGVSGFDHLYKSIEGRDEIVKALIRCIHNPNRHLIEFIEEEELSDEDELKVENPEEKTQIKGFFRIDGVKINLTATQREVFHALCTNDETRLAAVGFLGDKIYQIRKTITETMNRAGIAVGVNDIIKPPKKETKGSYQIVAEFVEGERTNFYDDDDDLIYDPEDEPCRVLVIEDEAERNNFLCGELRRLGFVVKGALNIAEAVETARKFRPDILSLDLQIPAGYGHDKETSWTGKVDAGLDALEEIRLIMHDVRAVLFTMLPVNDYPEILHRAEQLGVSINDFVSKNAMPKGGGTPESLLVGKIENLRDEIKSRVVARPDFQKPVVEMLAGCNTKDGRLKLRVNGNYYKTKKQSQLEKIIGFLLLNPNHIITLREIADSTGAEIPKDRGKKWAERIRSKIRNEWLRLSETEQTEPEKMILESYPDTKQAFRLNAHVSGEDNEE